MTSRRKPPSRSAAEQSLLALALALATALAWGQAPPPVPAGAGVVTNVSGPLSVQRADGSIKALAVNSVIAGGDTLYTEKDTYARVKFSDGGEVTLRPNSQMKLEQYAFNETKADEDNAIFRLVKGGLRSLTGLIGKRSKEKYLMNAPTATIGIRGTQFSLLFCQDDCGNLKNAAGQTPPNGLHVDVTEGQVVVANAAGQQAVAAGQAAFVQAINVPPVQVPPERAVKVVVPPAISSNKSGGVTSDNEPECVVQ